MRAKGFTLIELVVVIVILGILAATALPKFVDFKSDAANAAAQGVAGALSSATAINYAKYSISSGAAQPVTTATASCGATNANIMVGGVPAGMTIALSGPACSGAGSSQQCAVNNAANGATVSATATIVCTS